MEELIDDFLAETCELLDTLDGELAARRAEPQDRARLDAIFRCFHTVKASCGLFGLSRVEELAHAAEDVLAAVRSGKRVADPAMMEEVRTIACRIAELVQGLGPAQVPRPLGGLSLWLPQMADGLAAQLGKQVLLEVEGSEIEQEMINAIRGPLAHLVRNAIDHGLERPAERIRAGKSPTGGLRISLRRAEDQIVIEVADDGRGIPGEALAAKAVEAGLIGKKEAKRLSEARSAALAFAPGLSTASQMTAISGRGVGMDAARADIERIGGTVDVESRRGCGVKITMRIPLSGRSRAAPAKTCLVVDDSRVMRKFARQILESLGYAVEEAGHGREALARIEGRMPDLILLDWNMPEMGGLEFLHSLRGGAYRAQPKVIFCTPADDAEQIRAGIAAGADDYVVKPFDREAVAGKLKMLESSRLHQRAA